MIKSDKLVPEIQGGYNMLEKRNKQIHEQMEKLRANLPITIK